MNDFIDFHHLKLRKEIKYLLKSNSIFTQEYDDHKHITQKRLEFLLKQKIFDVSEWRTDPLKYIAISDVLHTYDLSLAVKTGVHLGLFAGSIMALGTDKHYYLKDAINSGEHGGCLAITELGHGSNLKDLETMAVYDHNNRAFIINTPTYSAQKFWIGNAGRYGTIATVFAQLYIGETYYGLHAFLVPIRKNGRVVKGVVARDNGMKGGLNGIDNGSLHFNNVMVPYDNMLDKFAQIDENGQYVSPIKSKEKRFTKMLTQLTGGRVTLASGTLQVAKKSLLIAIKYAHHRKQFGLKDEVPIITYRTHHLRLMPLLSDTFAFNMAINYMKRLIYDEIAVKQVDSVSKKMHMLSSAMKIYGSELASKTARTCRECCGGHGYSTANELVNMMADVEIYKTFEGDNNLLLMEVARYILMKYRKNQKVIKVPDDSYYSQIRYKYQESLKNTWNIFMSNMTKTTDMFKVWNDTLPYIVDMSKKYINKKVNKQFMLVANKVQVFKDMYNLNSMNILCNYNDINDKRIELCEKVCKDSMKYVELFDIDVSNIPIAQEDFQYHSKL